MKNFGERLKDALLDAGYTQSEFARSIGLDRMWLNHILKGRKEPSLKSLVKILKGLPAGTSIRYLICGIEG